LGVILTSNGAGGAKSKIDIQGCVCMPFTVLNSQPRTRAERAFHLGGAGAWDRCLPVHASGRIELVLDVFAAPTPRANTVLLYQWILKKATMKLETLVVPSHRGYIALGKPLRFVDQMKEAESLAAVGMTGAFTSERAMQRPRDPARPLPK